ncbi:nitroreductase family protein [Streptomyces sp. NPDC023327]|uniref:nitroreductase family protein n=1 Tax=Streptomyces sp. NPDC023327 TaxID=3157088 RepID=UPI0033C3F761
MSDHQSALQRWAVSPTVSLVRLDGTWLWEDPARGAHRRLRTVPSWLGPLLAQLLAGPPLPWQSLASAAEDCGVPADRTEGCLNSLVAAGLLVPGDTAGPDRDNSALRDRQWALVSPPADYTRPDTVDEDITLMWRQAAQEVPPPAYHHFGEGPRVTLPHPVLDAPGNPLDALGHLLYLTHGVIEDAAIGPLPRTRRAPPSHGAAHPFDLTVTTRGVLEEVRTYGYDPSEHALVPVADEVPDTGTPATEPGLLSEADVLTIHLVAERVQWRYRSSTAYPTIFLDLGHLVETLYTAAARLGWQVTELPSCGAPLFKPRAETGPVLTRLALRRGLAAGGEQ